MSCSSSGDSHAFSSCRVWICWGDLLCGLPRSVLQPPQSFWHSDTVGALPSEALIITPEGAVRGQSANGSAVCLTWTVKLQEDVQGLPVAVASACLALVSKSTTECAAARMNHVLEEEHIFRDWHRAEVLDRGPKYRKYRSTFFLRQFISPKAALDLPLWPAMRLLTGLPQPGAATARPIAKCRGALSVRLSS